MYFSQVVLCATVLSFLQAVAARPVIEGTNSESSLPGSTPSNIEVSGTEAYTRDGISSANGTETQTFSSATASSSATSGTNWSFHYWDLAYLDYRFNQQYYRRQSW